MKLSLYPTCIWYIYPTDVTSLVIDHNSQSCYYPIRCNEFSTVCIVVCQNHLGATAVLMHLSIVRRRLDPRVWCVIVASLSHF